MDAEIVGGKHPVAVLGEQFKSSVTAICFGSFLEGGHFIKGNIMPNL